MLRALSCKPRDDYRRLFKKEKQNLVSSHARYRSLLAPRSCASNAAFRARKRADFVTRGRVTIYMRIFRRRSPLHPSYSGCCGPLWTALRDCFVARARARIGSSQRPRKRLSFFTTRPVSFGLRSRCITEPRIAKFRRVLELSSWFVPLLRAFVGLPVSFHGTGTDRARVPSHRDDVLALPRCHAIREQ